jgi:hypothetical protein
VTLASNGVLTGSGSAAGTTGAVTTSAASLIAPGNAGTGTGTLTLNTLNTTAGSTFSYDLASSLQTELLTVSTLTGGGNLVFNLNNIGATTGVYTLIDFTSETGLITTQFSENSTTGIQGQFILTANSIQFNVTQAPEPGTTGLFFLGLSFLAYFGVTRRRAVLARLS